MKFNWTLGLIATMEWVPEKYLPTIKGSNGLYELRVEESSNIHRVFCFFDVCAVVILINGFQKKTDITPRKEVMRSKRLGKKYCHEKEQTRSLAIQ